jgi:hypothetical protein
MATTVEVPTFAQKNGVAGHVWIKRGCPMSHDPRADWEEAERVLSDQWLRARLLPWSPTEEILWQSWARKSLRPYIAIEAKANPMQLAADLASIEASLKLHTSTQTRLIAVLDGAPEFSRFCHLTFTGNPWPPEQVIDAKDTLFYKFCYSSFCLHGGVILDQEPCSLNWMVPSKPRRYQDGCAVAFPATVSLPEVLAAALRLGRVLSSYNTEQHIPWTDQLHARVSLSSSWAQAVRYLPDAWRNEIVIDPDSLTALEPGYQELCRAAGVKPGLSYRPSRFSQELDDAVGLAKVSEYLRRVS